MEAAGRDHSSCTDLHDGQDSLAKLANDMLDRECPAMTNKHIHEAVQLTDGDVCIWWNTKDRKPADGG